MIARLLLLFLCLPSAGCKPSLPADGIARFSLPDPRPEAVGPRPHSGRSSVLLQFDYAGRKKALEWEPQVWKKGTPLPTAPASRKMLFGPRQTLGFAIWDQTSNGLPFCMVSTEVRLDKGLHSGTRSVEMPSRPSGWSVAILPAASIEVGDGHRASIFGLIFHSEKIDLPPDSPLEAWAAKADAALLIRVRMTD